MSIASRWNVIFVFCVAILSPASLIADPWTPIAGDSSVYGSYGFESFDEFYRGTTKSDLPFGHLDQHTVTLGVEYGVTDDLALEFSSGYVRTDAGGGLGSEEGMNDSNVTARWRFLDEFAPGNRALPSMAVSVTGVVAGSYDEDDFPLAPGDGSHAAGAGLHIGKLIGESGLGVFTELGYHFREGRVPDQLLIFACLFQTIGDHFTISALYHQEAAQSGIDLGTPEFSPGRAPELKERKDLVEFAVGYEFKSGVYLGGSFGMVLDGRNTGDSEIINVSVAVPFS